MQSRDLVLVTVNTWSQVFNADWPFETVFDKFMGYHSDFRWRYTQLSQFSPCDTQLLVSGRCSGSEQGGEIVIFNLFAGKFTLQVKTSCKNNIQLSFSQIEFFAFTQNAEVIQNEMFYKNL